MFSLFCGFRLLVILIVVSLVGCSEGLELPDVTPVSGTLLINGQPASGAMVIFDPSDEIDFKDKRAFPYGITDETGTYQLTCFRKDDGAPPGEYGVRIIWQMFPLSDNPGPDRLNGQFATRNRSKLRRTIAEGVAEIEPITIDHVRVLPQSDSPRQGYPGDMSLGAAAALKAQQDADAADE